MANATSIIHGEEQDSCHELVDAAINLRDLKSLSHGRVHGGRSADKRSPGAAGRRRRRQSQSVGTRGHTLARPTAARRRRRFRDRSRDACTGKQPISQHHHQLIRHHHNVIKVSRTTNKIV